MQLAHLRWEQLADPDAHYGGINIENLTQRAHSGIAAILFKYFDSQQACRGQEGFDSFLYERPGTKQAAYGSVCLHFPPTPVVSVALFLVAVDVPAEYLIPGMAVLIEEMQGDVIEGKKVRME